MSVTVTSSVPMRALLAGARRKQADLVDLIQKLVRAESPSSDKAAVDACAALLAAHTEALGGRVRIHRQHGFGDLVEARFGPRSRSAAAARTLLLGHLDTVWPLGTLATMPCRLAADPAGGMRLWGPGVLDMKAGAAMALAAIEILAEADLLQREIVLLLTGDEEVGSPESRPVIERLAAGCARVFVLEPAQGLAYKTARKGT
ncbi:MAG: M20/M25/M40 family metallo-hydrolase, partial [Terracidiphilus sp.]